MLSDVADTDTCCTILGGRIKLRSPIGIAPFAGGCVGHPNGEIALSKAAASEGAVYCVPFYSGHPLSSIAEAVSAKQGQLMLQLYPARLNKTPSRPGGSTDGGINREYVTQRASPVKPLAPSVFSAKVA